MGRRTAGFVVVALTVTGAIASCSTGARPPAAPVPARSSPAGPVAAHTLPGTRVPGTPPAGHAPAGGFAVTERHLSFRRGTRPLPTTVWAPAAADRGPFPLVLFSHGLTARPADYAVVLRTWARAGFVVAAPAYPHTSAGTDINPLDVINQPSDASAVITRMLALNSTAGDALRGRIDVTRVAAAGHSAGAITTIGLFTANRDDRLDAGIVLAGEQVLNVPYTGRPAPMLFVHGKLDRTVPYASGLAAFKAVPWSRAMVTVTAGGHVAPAGDLAPVLATTTDFLRWSLYGDAAAKGRLRADATKGGTATFLDQLQ